MHTFCSIQMCLYHTRRHVGDDDVRHRDDENNSCKYNVRRGNVHHGDDDGVHDDALRRGDVHRDDGDDVDLRILLAE